MGAQRTQLVRKPFRKHRHGAVHQIDRRAALHGLVVDYRVGPHVMGHVGDMHAHFPDAVLYFAHRQRVVEVLGVRGVDREGRDTPEVAPLGDLFGRDAGVDGLGGLLDFGFEAVGKLVFRQDRVHLRVVVARHAQPLDQFAHGAFAAREPVGDAHHDLLAVAHVGIGALREINVHRHAARVGPYENLVRPDFGHAHVGLAVAFDDPRDLALQLSVAAAVHHHDLDAVAVQGVRGIALVDEDVALLPFDLHIDRTRGGHVGHALVVGQVGLHQTVFFACALLDDSLFEEASEDF